MEKELKIGFIGCGNVATALIGGILQSGYAPADILASDRIPSVRENKSAELGVRVISDNTEVVSFAALPSTVARQPSAAGMANTSTPGLPSRVRQVTRSPSTVHSTRAFSFRAST